MNSDQASLNSSKSSNKIHNRSTSLPPNVNNNNNNSNNNNNKSTNTNKSSSISNSTTSVGRSKSGFPVMELLEPETILTVGSHVVEVIQYLSEGGFAHIYMVKFVEYLNGINNNSDQSMLNKGDVLCLKRVFCMDQNGLNELRVEVETMKKLKNCSTVVKYFDSNAEQKTYPPAEAEVVDTLSSSTQTQSQEHFDSKFPDTDDLDQVLEHQQQQQQQNNSEEAQVPTQTYFEVLVLMELCPNKSLLDYMNDRLKTKLNDVEILNIMFDISRALFEMHCRPEPMIHKDIKIENVLVDKDNRFKLCDFGSTTPCYPIVTSHQDIAFLSNDIYVHTTPQYRAPEMIDLYRCLPINEKSDIWALGVFLYKLLFYTTPFELTGQFAILHSKYDIPINHYLSGLNNLIIVMLAENPSLRPNIYQIIHELCNIMKIDIPANIFDYYGQGPYDFNKYGQYQSKVQALQYQMYMMYQQKKVSDNELYLNIFEVASKQPVNMGKINQQQQQQQPLPASKNPYTSLKNSTVQPAPVFDSTDSKIQEITKKFPSVENLLMENKEASNKYPLDSMANSKDSRVPGVPEIQNIKQHKSNNPFPKIANTASQKNETTDKNVPTIDTHNVFFDQLSNDHKEAPANVSDNIFGENVFRTTPLPSHTPLPSVTPNMAPSKIGKRADADVMLSGGASHNSHFHHSQKQQQTPQQTQMYTNPGVTQYPPVTSQSNYQESSFPNSTLQSAITKPAKLELTFDNMDLRGSTPELDEPEVKDPKGKKRRSFNNRKGEEVVKGYDYRTKLNDFANKTDFVEDKSDDNENVINFSRMRGSTESRNNEGDFANDDEESVSQESISLNSLRKDISDETRKIAGIQKSTPSTFHQQSEPAQPRKSLNLRISEVDFDDNSPSTKSPTEFLSSTDSPLNRSKSMRVPRNTYGNNDNTFGGNGNSNNNMNQESSFDNIEEKKNEIDTVVRSVSNTLSSSGNNFGTKSSSNIKDGYYDQVLIPKSRNSVKSETKTTTQESTDFQTEHNVEAFSTKNKKKSLDLSRDRETEEIHPLKMFQTHNPTSSYSKTHGSSSTTSKPRETEDAVRKSFHRMSRKSLDLDRLGKNNSGSDKQSSTAGGDSSSSSTSKENKRRSIFGKFTKGF